MRATTAQPAALSLLDGDLLEDLDGVDPASTTGSPPSASGCATARGCSPSAAARAERARGAIAAAQQLLSIDRAHEGAWRALMRAYAARGERGMAIQAYERCRAVLADQLDAQPSEETQRLADEIRAPPGRAAPRAAAGAAAPPARRRRIARRAADARAADAAMSARPGERADPRGRAPRGGARVGVLPLQLVGTTEDDAHLATGLADEITSALARFRWMFLVSSSSLARFAAQTRDEAAIRRAFGIDFLLDGTVQRAGNRLRVSMRLLDLRAGNQVVWSRRFDREARRPADPAGRDRGRGRGADRPRDPADRGAARSPRGRVGRHRLRSAAAGVAADGAAGAAAVRAGGRIAAPGDRAGTRLCGGACLVRVLAHVAGRPGLGEGPAGGDRRGRAARRTGDHARPAGRAGADDRRPCAGVPASPAARGDVAARAGADAEPEPRDGLGAVRRRVRLSRRPRRGRAAPATLQETLAARSACVPVRHRLLHRSRC